MSSPISSSTTPTNSSVAPTTATTAPTTTPSTVAPASTSPPFQIYGLATGLNTSAIISKLTQMYSAPMVLLQQQQQVNLTEQAAWNDVQTKLTALQTAIQNLQAPSAAAGRIASTTPPNGGTAPFTVSATPQAAMGNYTVSVQNLATTAQLSGASGIATPISVTNATTNPLTSEGFGIVPTTGTVTINGTAITIDSATTLLGGTGTDSLQAKINAIAGLSMTYATDGSGNVSNVTISSTSTPGTPIQLGLPSDTSNVLTALRLTTASPVTTGSTYSVTSNGSLSGVNANAALTAAGISGTFNSNGTFDINGVPISYNSTDTLNTLMATINNSSAGVTASYDPLSDRVILQATSTGTGGIAVTDPNSSGLPAALHLTGSGATMVAGLPAQITVSGINGGNPIASPTNTVTGVIPGVTLNLTGTSGTSGPTTISVTQDTTALTTALQSFVTAYNAVQDTITKYTGVTQTQGSTTPTAGLLAGDMSLQNLANQLDTTVNGTTVTVNGHQYTLAALGISTGPPGTFGGSNIPTLDLQFNTTTASTALAATPGLAAAFVGNGSFASQTGTLFGNLGTTVQNWTSPLGNVNTALNELSAEYTDEYTQIQNWQQVIQTEQATLTAQFTAMETSVAALQAQGQAMAAQLGALTSSSSSGTSSGTSSSTGSSTGTTTGG